MTDSTSNLFDLSGHRAMITGGTQGVGSAIATAVADAGADVLLVGLNADEAAVQTLQRCRSAGVQAALITADLAQPPDQYLAELITAADQRMPGIDMLVNNAGTYIDRPFLEMDYERYRKTIDLNVTAGYFLTQSFARNYSRPSR